MAEIKVTASQLRTQADQLKALNTRFKETTGKLQDTEVALKAMWEGEANTAFHNAFNSDKVQMDNFYNAIELYVVKLQAIAQKYEQTEAINVNTGSTRNYK